ncbi:glycosyltransferase family 4 protein [Nocardioides sp. GXZ039]|uniref:glycosyltransferase family 4 protein n=1 Tax=Nocardioides sp. GXZ039 TaxID=3136018 RepID=UPI0030F3DD96
MRILHVADEYLPRIGGIELHVHDLATRQRRMGHQVTVVTGTRSGESEDPDGPVVVRDRRDHAEWLQRADVVHAHLSVVSPFASRILRRAVALGIPSTATVHSTWSERGPVAALNSALLPRHVASIDWTAVSERAAAPVRAALGVPVAIQPDAVEIERWRPPSTPPPGPPRVVCVMRLTRTKRAVPLATILRAVADETTLHATIVGDGPERPHLESALRREGLADRVRLTGTLSRQAVRRHLESAAVFLAPAHREAFGIAALEARTLGLPVVASSRSGVATFIEHGVDGLLGIDDKELSEQVARLLRDPSLRGSISAHNRHITPDLGWPAALRRAEEAYRRAGAITAAPLTGVSR